MSTSTIYVTGIAKWARVFGHQMDTKFGEKFHITVYPDEAGVITLKQSGSRASAKTDEDGTFYKFSRDNKKEFKGQLEVLGPPKVLDPNNETFTQPIGNGSKVTVKLSVYDSSKGKGTRLEAVRVDEHVPYEENSGAEYPF